MDAKRIKQLELTAKQFETLSELFVSEKSLKDLLENQLTRTQMEGMCLFYHQLLTEIVEEAKKEEGNG